MKNFMVSNPWQICARPLDDLCLDQGQFATAVKFAVHAWLNCVHSAIMRKSIFIAANCKCCSATPHHYTLTKVKSSIRTAGP